MDLVRLGKRSTHTRTANGAAQGLEIRPSAMVVLAAEHVESERWF